MRNNRLGFGVGTLVVLLAIFFGFLFRQAIIDQITIWTFQPSREITSIAEENKFTGRGLATFYASRPQLDDRDDFNKNCGEHEVSTAVLGCYIDSRIYIFRIVNSELDGIQEVTAAHEMLHAAYARLSPSERKHINTLLLDRESALQHDAAFTERISIYKKLPRDQYIDELHSVIGTEVTDVGTELARYYQRYFKDRDAIVVMHAQYADVFTKLQNESEALATSLNTLAEKINNRVEQYNAAAEKLARDIENFNQRARTQGSFRSQAEFDSERSQMVSRSDSLETMRRAIDKDIAKYKADYKKFQAMEVHLDTLNVSINSSLEPAPEISNAS